MKKSLFALLFCISLFTMVAGCSSKKQLLETKISFDEINKIKVITSMGNPEYGTDCKIITDKDEINIFVNTFNSGLVGKKVFDEDVNIAMPSYYYFYKDDTLVASFSFNGNDSNIVWYKKDYYYIDYGEVATPFELYKSSNAEVIVVDEKGEEMERPQK